MVYRLLCKFEKKMDNWIQNVKCKYFYDKQSVQLKFWGNVDSTLKPEIFVTKSSPTVKLSHFFCREDFTDPPCLYAAVRLITLNYANLVCNNLSRHAYIQWKSPQCDSEIVSRSVQFHRGFVFLVQI